MGYCLGQQGLGFQPFSFVSAQIAAGRRPRIRSPPRCSKLCTDRRITVWAHCPSGCHRQGACLQPARPFRLHCVRNRSIYHRAPSNETGACRLWQLIAALRQTRACLRLSHQQTDALRPQPMLVEKPPHHVHLVGVHRKPHQRRIRYQLIPVTPMAR
jgi:hypothetical protein